MKIAILTFCRAFSYGALLQCYALSTILRKEGHEVKLLRSDLKGEDTFRYIINSLTRCSNFRQFRKDFLPPVAKRNETFDLYIVGSDQVWNPEVPIEPMDYFFSFLPPSAKRISYAASFGMDAWNYKEEFSKQVKNCLNKFAAITVREENGVNICRDTFGLPAKVVLDPTLLLGDFQNLYTTPLTDNGSLFYYRVSHKTDWGNLAETMTEELGLQLLTPSVRKRIDTFPVCRGINSVYPTMQEWLDAIRTSSFVLTDSFHTMVFAILNRKPFIILPSAKSRMSRVVSLLSNLNIGDRYYPDIKEVMKTRKWKEPIDYNRVHSRLAEMQKESLNILKDSIVQ